MTCINRRRFLEQSLLAATAALGAGAEPATASTRRRSPIDRISIAVIGVHGRGKDHLHGYTDHSDVDVVAICDVDENVIPKAQKIVTDRGKPAPKAYQDIRRLLEDRSIDAVSIATPNHWHALAAIWAMQAGKDVYVEKPVSHTLLEGRRMIEAARRYGRICQTGTQIRSSAGSRAAIDFIHSGGIGKVTLARGLCYKRRESIGHQPDSEIPAGVDYDIWLGPAAKRPFNANRFHYNWHWNWDYGNGDIGNQGPHQMDVARWALNRNRLPDSVLGLGGRFGYVDDGQTPNTELAFFDYGDAHLIFEVRGLPTEALKGVKIGNIIYGSEGYMAFDTYDTAAAFDNAGNKLRSFSGGGDHYGNFLDAVRRRDRRVLNADIEQGHLSCALCHLANISYLLGKPAPFEPRTRAFGDDREAYETYGRFEQHLADSGIRLSAGTYLLGPRLAIDSRHERFAAGLPDGLTERADSLLSREYRAPFVVPESV